MGITGLTGGRLNSWGKPKAPHKRLPTIEKFYKGRISADEIAKIRADCLAKGLPLYNALMDRAGWPAIPLDGKLLVSHQDALLIGGKVQAPGGYADHVIFPHPDICAKCNQRTCVEICSGQAITHGANGVPVFDREKCIHCGACLWNCASERPDGSSRTVLEFRAGTGGLHSAEN
jgi:electron-transferring-flavoprotein dehydrogenase